MHHLAGQLDPPQHIRVGVEEQQIRGVLQRNRKRIKRCRLIHDHGSVLQVQQGEHPLVDLLLDDYLVVDVSKPFTEASYFEIEQATLDARAHQTCGGRWLNDDFLDTYYTLLINAGKGPLISDGVDQATVPSSKVFPYLAPANRLRAKGRHAKAVRPEEALDAHSPRAIG